MSKNLYSYLIFCETVMLPANPIWEYYPIKYKNSFQIKRDKIDTLLKKEYCDSLNKLITLDTSTLSCLTTEEKYLLGFVLYTNKFIEDTSKLDKLFLSADKNSNIKKQFSNSPYEKLIYRRGISDELISTLYQKFHNVLDNLLKTNQVTYKTYTFYKLVFPKCKYSFDSTMRNYEEFVRKYPRSKESSRIYDFYYRKAQWNKSGFCWAQECPCIGLEEMVQNTSLQIQHLTCYFLVFLLKGY